MTDDVFPDRNMDHLDKLAWVIEDQGWVAVPVDAQEDPAPTDLLFPSNLVVNGEGSLFFSFGTVIALRNNGDVSCAVEGTTSSGYNYSDDASCGFDQATDTQNGADPQLPLNFEAELIL